MYRSAPLQVLPVPQGAARWLLDARVAAAAAAAAAVVCTADSRGPLRPHEPSSAWSPAFSLLRSRLRSLRDKSISEVVADTWECTGRDVPDAARLSRDEKNPCCEMLWPSWVPVMPSLALTISDFGLGWLVYDFVRCCWSNDAEAYA